ncbi:MAG TPA: putative glycoside hydrolase [Verrucomicrobiota bacterium]|nr:putative glycoside hydrolase [Verrucomicrobiota bacterium]HRZ35526.1 putative glycoside hydrolase [Candidatus Paceibacterota bacterium]HRZ53943.1 putative glycoside hydrolase [Candidatus Paceibacterota bacterium]
MRIEPLNVAVFMIVAAALHSSARSAFPSDADTSPARAPSAVHIQESNATAPGWRLPPTRPVTRVNPRLVNYFHMDLAEGRVDHKERRLAQWNVVILNHDIVLKEKLSLTRMRRTNPRIKLLAWIPLQGPNDGMSKGVPAPGDADWYARRADGTYLAPHWGGHLMDVCIQGRAWLRHVLRYVRRHCLGPGGYDGLMLDCLWAAEPTGHDANSDGVHDARDTAAWRESMLFLLRQLRAEFPDAILVGNGGLPWPADCPYYEYANGCMHENALGDQFGGTEWLVLWNACQTALSRISNRPACHLIQGDIRADRRTQAAAARQRALTPNDCRRFRLGLATALLVDGAYFGFDRGDCLHGQLWWFDQYDLDLGAPLGACVEGRVGPGTFARDFERGLVVVNPTQTPVSIADTLDSSRGIGGAKGSAFIVPPRDARILPAGPRKPAASPRRSLRPGERDRDSHSIGRGSRQARTVA